jgi:hypothetical protein
MSPVHFHGPGAKVKGGTQAPKGADEGDKTDAARRKFFSNALMLLPLVTRLLVATL